MTMQYSTKVRNEQMRAIIAALGPGAVMRFYSSELPESCDAADPSGEVAEVELDRQPFLMSIDGKLVNNGVWLGEVHKESGVPKSFRIIDFYGECHIQGTVSKTGDGGDIQLEVDGDKLELGQRLNIGGFTIVNG
jgi:hypothetical protein